MVKIKQNNVNNNNNIKLETSKDEEKIYDSNNLISGYVYNSFLNLEKKTIYYSNEKKEEYNLKYNLIKKIINDYELISNFNETINIIYGLQYQKSKITKYHQFNPEFNQYNEIIIKYNLLKEKNKDILIFEDNLAAAEYISYQQYKYNKLHNVVRNNIPDYEKYKNNYNKFINNIAKIYNINTIKYNDTLYNLPFVKIDNLDNKYNKYDIIIYSYYDFYFDSNLYMYENILNIPTILVGSLIGLKYTNLGGTFIIHFGSVAYKPIADIYLLLSRYFIKSDLYYPEFSNLFKKTGTYGIFRDFKGINDNELQHIVDLLNDVKKVYPLGSESFNIYTPEIRDYFGIKKPIDSVIAKNYKHITGFLNYKEDDPIYNDILLFNESRYIKQNLYMNKLIKFLDMPLEYLESIKIPTEEQIINSVLYCQKWGLKYFDKYNEKPFQDKFGKQILTEIYGLQEPIIYNFKTPSKFHKIKSIKLYLSRRITKKQNYKLKSNKSKSNKSKSSRSLFAFSKKKNKSHKLSFIFDDSIISKKLSTKLSKKRNRELSTLTNKSIHLLPELEESYDLLNQTGHLIDSRRNITIKDETKQLPDWYVVNKLFRDYKHTQDTEKEHLDIVVRRKLNDDSISQAWLKLYEIITDCKIVPTDRSGTFKSFHICEAPGTFINCLNNYIHTKTKYDNFDWKAQSLNPKIAKIGDQFGLIKGHPERWNWGLDGTGDMTNINNIKYYAKFAQGINLMTSDCGLDMKTSGYEKVAFASILSILYMLPISGTMVYKIMSPISEPVILNLIYIAYSNFNELIFYKPVQNNWSREFYIVGKGYKGTDKTILDRFLDVLNTFKEGQKTDLFNDKYPEIFVYQMAEISKKLANNWAYTIERNIYYLDNFKKLSPNFIKLKKQYFDEKNQDWINKYKPMRIQNETNKL
jgi:hypothetical protein